jgi:predicted RNA binding protein YcfA (HicA-like mRNA interferase family)
MAVPISRREPIRKFCAFGFEGPFSGGRHQFMKKGELKVRIPNPHRADRISAALVREIVRQAGIKPEEWSGA